MHEITEVPPSRFDLMKEISLRDFPDLAAVNEPTVSGKYLHWMTFGTENHPLDLVFVSGWLGLRYQKGAGQKSRISRHAGASLFVPYSLI